MTTHRLSMDGWRVEAAAMPPAGRPTARPGRRRPSSGRWAQFNSAAASCKRVVLPSGHVVGTCVAEHSSPSKFTVGVEEQCAKNAMMPDKKEWALNGSQLMPNHTFRRLDFPDVRVTPGRRYSRGDIGRQTSAAPQPGAVSPNSPFHHDAISKSVEHTVRTPTPFHMCFGVPASA